jgi:hypothetical protein
MIRCDHSPLCCGAKQKFNSGQAEQQGDKKGGLSTILTEESFAIRQILLVSQEGPC